MSDFSFKRGTFTKLRANSVIHLGRLERNIYEGEVVEYDGLQLKFGGQTTEMPELKAGVKRGWLSIVEETPAAEEEVVKKEVPAPKKEMPVQTVYDEERAVGEVNPQKEEKSTKFPVVVESQDDDIITVAKVDSKSGAEVTTTSDGVSEMQDAESVSTIKLSTSSKQKTVISDGNQASAEINKLDNLEAPVTKTASTKPDVDIKDDVSVKLNLVETEEPEMTPLEEQALENKQLLQVIDGGVESAQGAIALGKDNSKIKTLPGGIEWDTSKHWSKRAKIALEMYGDQPEVIQEIIKVESKGVIAAIEKGLED